MLAPRPGGGHEWSNSLGPVLLDGGAQSLVFVGGPAALGDGGGHLCPPSLAAVFVGAVRDVVGDGMPLGGRIGSRVLCGGGTARETRGTGRVTGVGGGRRRNVPRSMPSRSSLSSSSVHGRRSRWPLGSVIVWKGRGVRERWGRAVWGRITGMNRGRDGGTVGGQALVGVFAGKARAGPDSIIRLIFVIPRQAALADAPFFLSFPLPHFPLNCPALPA